MAIIYKITNTITNEEYVGKTIRDDIYERFSEHIKGGRHVDSSSKLTKSLREYGSLNHTIVPLEYCDDELVLEREQYWIDELNTLHLGLNIKNEKINNSERLYWGEPKKAKENLDNENVWNKGISPKDETRRKISETKKKKHALGLYKNYGHLHTEETKKRLSEIAKKRGPISAKTKSKLAEKSTGRTFYHSISDKKRVSLKSYDPIPEGYVKGKGTVWINKNGENISIDIWDLEYYINNGYVKGRKNV